MPTAISPNNWLDDPAASITASSASSTLPVASLRTQMLAEIWRSSGTGTATLSVDLGALRPVRVVAFCAPRTGLLPLASGTIAARLSATAIGNAELGAETRSAAMPRGYWCWVLPAQVTARYLQLTITSGQAYVQGGRLWVGDGLYYAASLAEDEFEPSLGDGPAEAVRRSARVTLARMSQTEADLLEDAGIGDGTSGQLLAIPRTERADRTAIIGKMTALPAPRPRLRWNPSIGQLHSATLAVQEDR